MLNAAVRAWWLDWQPQDVKSEVVLTVATTMESTVGDKDADMTTMLTDNVEQCNQAADSPVVISSDLRHAIKLLRSVPLARVTLRHNRHDTSRPPLRPVNEHCQRHRLSLPPQLPHQLTDHLDVRQCSSMTDDVIHTTGACVVIPTNPTTGKNHCDKTQLPT